MTTIVGVIGDTVAEADITALKRSSKKSLPSCEEQLATIESMMMCYDTPITQAPGYVRDLLTEIIALRSGEIPYRDVIEPILDRIKRSMRLNVLLNAEGPPQQIIEGVISADDHDNIARLINNSIGE